MWSAHALQVVLNFTLVDYVDSSTVCDDKAINDIIFRTGIVLGNASSTGRVPDSMAVYLDGYGVFNFPIIDPSQANRTGTTHFS